MASLKVHSCQHSDHTHCDHHRDNSVPDIPENEALSQIPAELDEKYEPKFPTDADNNDITPTDSAIFSPCSLVSSSSDIFERSVQDQGTIPSISRRSSFNKMGAIQRSKSFTSPDKCPQHLTSEDFVPTCLDASTEILNNNQDLSNIEVIQSNYKVNDLLDQNYRKKSLTRHNTINSIDSSLVDYSDSKKLNFVSFNDLINDEFETENNCNLPPISRKNSTIFISPALTKTQSK